MTLASVQSASDASVPSWLWLAAVVAVVLALLVLRLTSDAHRRKVRLRRLRSTPRRTR